MGRPIVVNIVAILDVLFGILMVLFGISFLALYSYIELYGTGLIPDLAYVLDLLTALGLGDYVFLIIGSICSIIAAITFITTWGLLRGKGWARILTIVFSILWIILGLLSLPNLITMGILLSLSGLVNIGIMAINALILFFFFRSDVKAFFGPAPSETYQPPTTYQASQATQVPLPPPPPQGADQKAPTCPKCGQPLTWIEQYQRWYCYYCQQYS